MVKRKFKMNEKRILDELIEVLQSQGIEIRSDFFGGTGGGLCVVKDKKIFFIDTDATAAENAAKCAQAVLESVDIDTIYIKPDVREFLEKVN